MEAVKAFRLMLEKEISGFFEMGISCKYTAPTLVVLLPCACPPLIMVLAFR